MKIVIVKKCPKLLRIYVNEVFRDEWVNTFCTEFKDLFIFMMRLKFTHCILALDYGLEVYGMMIMMYILYYEIVKYSWRQIKLKLKVDSLFILVKIASMTNTKTG